MEQLSFSHLAARDIMVALKATVLSFPLCARESRREGGGEGEECGEDGEGGKGGRLEGGKLNQMIKGGNQNLTQID